MRILYVINTGLIGGLQRHVLCLMQCLCAQGERVNGERVKGEGVNGERVKGPSAEVAVAINAVTDPRVVEMFEKERLKVYLLGGKSGHDLRVVGRFKKVLEDFKPDVIHAHGLPIVVGLWMLLGGKRCPVVHSIHTPSGKPTLKGRVEHFVWDHVVDYWLPVSGPTWAMFKRWHPNAKGEVFFNPLRMVATGRAAGNAQTTNFIVGMVGRAADQKDWPSFHAVAALVGERVKGVEFLNAGEEKVCNGREAIAKMDLFMMTSKHEQLPTTVLECFALGTPICGFIPDGGTTDILQFSTGPVRDAFIKERSCEKLADIVLDLLAHPEKRAALVADGRQILENHFDAEKLCKGQLMEVYERLVVGG